MRTLAAVPAELPAPRAEELAAEPSERAEAPELGERLELAEGLLPGERPELAVRREPEVHLELAGPLVRVGAKSPTLAI